MFVDQMKIKFNIFYSVAKDMNGMDDDGFRDKIIKSATTACVFILSGITNNLVQPLS